MIIFGPGIITMTPKNVSPATPFNIGYAQEISYDETFTNKTLYGQNRRAIAVGAGTIKATGKVKAAKFSAAAVGALIYGVTPTVGSTMTAIAEAGTVPASSTFVITVVNSATWTADQGVVYTNTGLPLTRVASVTAVGQYSVAAGVYTFFSADASAKVLITYNWTSTTLGFNIPVGNPVLGPTITLGVNITVTDPTNNNVGTWQIFNAVIAKWAIGTKLEDFVMPEFDFECYVNANGQFGQWNFPDAS